MIRDVETPSIRGGKRAGAGRKKTGRCRDAPHRRRPSLSARHPVHVVLRNAIRSNWRNRDFYKVVHGALRGTLGRHDFRVVHVSIQDNHLHLLVEASDRRALTRGADTHRVSCASRARVRAQQLGRHNIDLLDRSKAAIDDMSSAITFDGWRGRRLQVPAGYDPLPVSPPTTELLASDWKLHGLIGTDERPGPLIR